MHDVRSNADRVVDRLGADFGAILISRVAAEETPLYREIIESYRQSAKGRKPRDHPLAMGLTEIVAVASPFAFEAGKLVISSILDVAKGTVEDAAKNALAPRLESWIKSRFGSPAPVEIPMRDIDEIVRNVRKDMESRGVAEDLNSRISEVVRKALSSEPSEPP
jgi:hypothetical protein